MGLPPKLIFGRGTLPVFRRNQALGGHLLFTYRVGHCQSGRLIRFAPAIFVSPKVFSNTME
jgi:hypothetical protein